jgi:3-phosphoshikimate 1-carboxyvinyltransferase
LATKAPVRIDDARPIATSFPDFLPLMNRLGAGFEEAEG